LIRFIASVGLGCALALSPARALAQTGAEAAAAEARIQAGPISLTPRFVLRDVGVDTNVLNEEQNPQRDFTMTTGPGLDAWMRVGRLWVSSKSDVEWVYFADTETQRSFNVGQEVRLDLDLMHVVPHATVGYSRQRRRPNLEIDARVLEISNTKSGGLLLKLGPRTSVDLKAGRATLDYGAEFFAGTALANALNREVDHAGLRVEYAATPLTTIVFEGELQRERFEFDPIRDSHSFRIMPGLSFKPLALISGRASVGLRKIDLEDDRVPDFAGVVSSVDVAYTVRDAFRVTVRTARDVDYSFDPVRPYFVSMGIDLEVVRVIGLYWDVVARAGRTTLDYQALETGVPMLAGDERDVIDQFGVGLGRHLGENIRVGVDVVHGERRSDLPGRSYRGWRTGGTVTYGF
jgi:hypothetical protein